MLHLHRLSENLSILNNKEIWKHSPIASAIVFEISTIGHFIRMFVEKSSEGQSLISWFLVSVGLLFWVNWYRLFTPEQKIPRYVAIFSIFFHLVAAGVVVYFRHWYI